MLDGDFFGAVNPFYLHDPKRTSYLYETLTHLIIFHQKNGYKNFIINYVFENEIELKKLTNKLSKVDYHLCCFLLCCKESVQKERIIKRNSDQMDWELKRAVALNKILKRENNNHAIGQNIDVSELNVSKAAKLILGKCGNHH